MTANRLLECAGCGLLATDIAAAQLGWRRRAVEPAIVWCHGCLARMKEPERRAGTEGPAPVERGEGGPSHD